MALQAECFALKSHHDKFLLYISVQLVIQAGRAAETLRLCAVLIPKIPKPISAIVAGSGIALSATLSEKLTGMAGRSRPNKICEIPFKLSLDQASNVPAA